MVTKRINIENLRIKLPRKMRSTARDVGTSVGTDIARRIANAASRRTGSFTVDELSLGRVPRLSSVAEHAADKIEIVMGERGRK